MAHCFSVIVYIWGTWGWALRLEGTKGILCRKRRKKKVGILLNSGFCLIEVQNNDQHFHGGEICLSSTLYWDPIFLFHIVLKPKQLKNKEVPQTVMPIYSQFVAWYTAKKVCLCLLLTGVLDCKMNKVLEILVFWNTPNRLYSFNSIHNKYSFIKVIWDLSNCLSIKIHT